MSWLRATFAGVIACGLCMSAADADDFQHQHFKDEHEHAVNGNPAGVHFTIAVRNGQKRFRIGERITLDYTFTAEVPGKYLAGASNRDLSGRSTFENFVVDRPDDAADPLDGFFELYSVLYCSYIVYPHTGSTPISQSSPATESVSLTQYLRFRKPGHYRLYATTRQVVSADARPTSVRRRNPYRPSVDDPSLLSYPFDYGGPLLASDNIVEFEILPQDMKDARDEVETIIARSKASSGPGLTPPDAVRLFEIGTPQAHQAAAQLLPSDSVFFHNSGGPYEAIAAILAAPERSEAIKLVRQRLLDRAVALDQNLLLLLPVLQLVEKNPGLKADDIRNGGRLNGDRFRNLLLANMAAVYQELMASLDHREPANRAVAIRLLHNHLQITKACNIPIPLSAEDAEKLKLLHWATLPDLPERDLSADVFNLRWTEGIPQEQILAVLEKVYDNLPANSDHSRIIILRSIAGYDPQLAGKLFRRRVVDGWTPNLSNFISESWYGPFGGPDLDDYFAKVFGSAHTEDMERNAPLLARFGTVAILDQIKKVYEVQDAKWPCSVQAGMLTYFLRVAPAYGEAQTRIALEKSYGEKQLNCWEPSVLVSIALLYQAPQLETLANEALDDPRPLAAFGAARTLGIMVPRELPYQRLLDRFQKLHQEWPDYAAHANDSAYRARWESGYDKLEDILIRLLTNAPLPKATPLWPAVLEACVTDECRTRLGVRLRESGPTRVQLAH
jgi:hypothetical protein